LFTGQLQLHNSTVSKEEQQQHLLLATGFGSIQTSSDHARFIELYNVTL
jgi:hypothetical protein